MVVLLKECAIHYVQLKTGYDRQELASMIDEVINSTTSNDISSEESDSSDN